MPPHNLGAERAVLGAMLRYPPAAADAAHLLQAEHFYADHHQKIFRAIVFLWHAGKTVDLTTVSERLHQLNQDDGDTPAYLGELWDSAPTAVGMEDHAQIVRDRATARMLLHACAEIMRHVGDGRMPSDDALALAEREIFAVSAQSRKDAIVLRDAINRARDRIDERVTGARSVRGIPSGWDTLDAITAGLQPAEFTICAARPSTGKTAWAVNLAHHVALEQNVPVLFASLEQQVEELAERFMCLESGTNSHLLRRGYLRHEDTARLISASETLSDVPIYIDDCPQQTMLHISGMARRYRMRHNIGLLIVDYLGLIEPEVGKQSREREVATISRRLKQLARELKIPVVALAQLNREPEKNKGDRPKLSHLRDSGSQEQDADVVLLLHRPVINEPTREPALVEPITVIIAKQRNGPTGEIELSFRKDCMRFESYVDSSPFNKDG
jgi:replicative DNA helicase